MTAPALTDPAAAVPLDGGLPPRSGPSHRSLPVAIAFVGYPLLWFLGLGVLSFPLAGAVALWLLLRRRGPWEPVPGSVAVWFAFLAWTATALIVLGPLDRVLAYAYRSSIYLAATALLVLVVATPRRVLGDRAVLQLVSALWIATVLGGLVALMNPGLELTTVAERLLPRRLLDIGLVRNIVHLQVAAESRILGLPVGRPEAPFPFTNAWGSNLALLTPAVLATWRLGTSRRWRVMTGALLLAAVAPWVLSLNRGSWLSLTVGLLYVGARSLRDVPTRRYVAAVVVAAVVAVAVLLSPLGGLLADRLDGPGHSDAGRTSLYVQAIELGRESPVVGHGAPQPNREEPGGTSIGTHGQLWLLLVSHGVPGVVLYVAFFATAWFAAVRWRAPHAVWLEAVLVVGAVQFPIYELLPAQTVALAIVAALCIRGHRAQVLREARP